MENIQEQTVVAAEKERVNLSIDYAIGKDSYAWYFRIGEAF